MLLEGVLGYKLELRGKIRDIWLAFALFAIVFVVIGSYARDLDTRMLCGAALLIAFYGAMMGAKAVSNKMPPEYELTRYLWKGRSILTDGVSFVFDNEGGPIDRHADKREACRTFLLPGGIPVHGEYGGQNFRVEFTLRAPYVDDVCEDRLRCLQEASISDIGDLRRYFDGIVASAVEASDSYSSLRSRLGGEMDDCLKIGYKSNFFDCTAV